MRSDSTAFEFAVDRVEQLPPDDLLKIVFSDRSNVGKSSLINKLVDRKALARASATPGKIGTVSFYRLASCRLVGLPGYGYTKVSQSGKLRWANLMKGYFSTGRRIRLVVRIMDMRHKPTTDNLHMIDLLSVGGFPFVVVMTKSGKLNKGERTAQIQLCDDLFQNRKQVRRLSFSSTNGEGLDVLKEWITAAYAAQE